MKKEDIKDLYNICINAINCFLNFKNGIELDLSEFEKLDKENHELSQNLSINEFDNIKEEEGEESSDDEKEEISKKMTIYLII